MDHIDTTCTDIDDTMWTYVSAVVKQWIYNTIFVDLVQTIIKLGDSAQELWNCLAEVFQDNKTTRVVYLEEQFNNTCLDAFSNVANYRSHLKSIAYQLANVRNPNSETKMVLQLVVGLNKGEYDTITTLIQHSDSLPSFNKANSQLQINRKNQTTKARQSFSTCSYNSTCH